MRRLLLLLVAVLALGGTPRRDSTFVGSRPGQDPLRVLVECDSRCRGPNDRDNRAHLWYAMLGLLNDPARGFGPGERRWVPVGTQYGGATPWGISTASEIYPGVSCRQRLADLSPTLESVYSARRPSVCVLVHGGNDVADARAALGDVPGVTTRVFDDFATWAARVDPYCDRVIVSTMAEHTGQPGGLPYYIAINDLLQAGGLGPGVEICDLSAMPSSGFPADDLPHPEVLADGETEAGWMRAFAYSTEGEAWMGRKIAECIWGRSFRNRGAEVFP